MNARLSAIKSHFANWREWELNPIVIKELRQAVRSRILSGILMLFLLLLFLGSVASLAGQGMARGEILEMGPKMFDACLAVLAVSSLVFIPIYTGIRLALEQHEADLVLYTPLPVPKLVQGKFLAGVYIAGLFFSVCAPFMTFSTLLRGIDWLTIQFVLFVLFFAICVAVLVAIAVAVLPFPVLIKLAFGGAFALALIVVCYLLLLFFFGVVQSGIGPSLRRSSFGYSFASLFGLAMFGAWTSYSLSITYIVKNSSQDDPHGYGSISKSSND